MAVSLSEREAVAALEAVVITLRFAQERCAAAGMDGDAVRLSLIEAMDNVQYALSAARGE